MSSELYIKCPECDGEGLIEDGSGTKQYCPQCDESKGYIPAPHPAAVPVGELEELVEEMNAILHMSATAEKMYEEINLWVDKIGDLIFRLKARGVVLPEGWKVENRDGGSIRVTGPNNVDGDDTCIYMATSPACRLINALLGEEENNED